MTTTPTPNPRPNSHQDPNPDPRPNLHPDQILHALANPTPPPNLEQRILQTLEEHRRHDPARPQTLRRRLHTLRHRLHPAAQTRPSRSTRRIPAAAAALLATALLTLSWTTHHPTAPTTTPQPSLTPTTPNPVIQSQPRRSCSNDPPPVYTTATTVSTNVPPPPLPLTDQEKLLLQLAQTRDPDQLALLNPEIRARQQAADEAEFQTFFKPPPPLPNLDQTPRPTTPTTQTGDTL